MGGYIKTRDKLIRAVFIVLSIAILMGGIGVIKAVYEKRRLPSLIKAAVSDHVNEVGGTDAAVEIRDLSFDGEDEDRATVLCLVGETECSFLVIYDGDSWCVAEESRAE